MYSIGGVKKDSYEGEPFFSVLAIPTQGQSIRAIADDMAEHIKNGEIKNVSEDKANGYPSLKREIYGLSEVKPVVLYQHIVVIGTTAVIMQGVADDNYDKYVSEFEKLSNTVDKR